ncbi:MAG: energy transducer TonB [Polaromonas sp.]|nr:energy transducer TonB [Polaromonas sp.]
MPSPTAVKPLISRNVTIALSVVLLHAGLIWALQSGLLIRAAEILIPVTVLSQWVDEPVQAQPAKPQPPEPPKPALPTQPTPARPAPVSPVAPTPAPPLAVAAPAAQATVQAAPAPAPSPPAKSAVPAPAANPPAAQAAAAAAVVQQPSSNADYLQNPKPAYPALSARLGETGRTVYKVWIGTDGKPQRAELVSSSGFPRLDKAAYDTVMSWRYVPGMRNGVAEAMAVNVPIHWELRS